MTKFLIHASIMDTDPHEIEPPMIHQGAHTIEYAGGIYVVNRDLEGVEPGYVHYFPSEYHWRIQDPSNSKVQD